MRISYLGSVSPLHTANGTAYNTSAALTDVSSKPDTVISANTLEIGSEIEVLADGNFSNTGTPTLLLGFYYGGIAGVALAASTAITTTTAAASWPFQLYYRGTVRSLGTAGSIEGQGRLYLPTSLTALTLRAIPETLAARTVSIDTTAPKAITVGAQWGTNNALNTLTCTNISIRLTT